MSEPDDSSSTGTSGFSNGDSPAPAATSSRPLQTDLTGNDDVIQSDKQGALLNYYFVFLALFLAVVCMFMYALHRRRKIRKARFRNNGQNALARDVDGWTPNGRRWVGGSWAARFDRHNRFGTRALGRDSVDEGLNELGEAPPPYKSQEARLEAGSTPSSSYNGPAVPLRTLSRGAAGKPPGYDEATGRSSSPPPPSPPPPPISSANEPAAPSPTAATNTTTAH